MNIAWFPSPNYSPGRRKYDGQAEQVLAIVDHITGGNYPGCRSWLCNPAAKASAHYIVARSGEVVQLVKGEDTAWHAGIVNKPSWALYDSIGYNPNRWTIGIEHEGYDGTLTKAQYQATLELHRYLIDKYNIPIDDNHIVGHYRVDSVNRPYCPGPQFPWARLFLDLKGVSAVAEDWKLNLIEMAKAQGIIDKDHDPDMNAPIWFVLAVALRLKGAL